MYACFGYTLRVTARPVVTFTPNWSAIFLHEAMSLSCNVDSAPQDNPAYSWYKDHKKINTVQKIHHIPSADWNAAGSYQCQAETGDKSDPVRLNITDEVVILQAPPSVFEGDNITLRCHSLSVQGAENTTFYKDGQIVGSGTSELTLQAELNSTGNYKCRDKPETVYNGAEGLYVACVTELFPPPRVSISVDPVVEGAEMRVTCATLPQRAKTSLEFAFNRNGRKVQEFSSSDTYSVQSAQEDDAGNYTCEAKTSSSSVKKRSRTHQSFSRPQIKVSPDQVTEGDTVTMMCSAVNTKQEFAFYRNGQEVQGFGPSGEYQVQSVQEGDTGSYTCQESDSVVCGILRYSHSLYLQDVMLYPGHTYLSTELQPKPTAT
uniref:Ig-like domain-containing protein n=1 Tax=Leptobrachium leishanense TaxID=445787 RepID=A0A8C5QRE0_9ANUR